MSIKKRTTGAISADATPSVGLGAAYALLRRVDVVSSADTSVAVTITDRDGVTVYTLASGNYTTKVRQYPVPLETVIVDTGGDAQIDTEGGTPALVVRSPLAVAITGIGSGTVTVDCFVESDRIAV